MSSTAPDLSFLSVAERGILRLLAEGHTTKSIASLTGRSVSSINEHLRDARRKTGMGSSRELARLLREQENRNKQIGVAEGVTLSPSQREAPALPARRIVKGSIMAIGALALIATVSLMVADLGRQDPPAAQQGHVGNQAGSVGFNPESSHARLRAEPRDAAWATAAEAALRARYAAVESVAQGEALRVTCGSTLCEVAGGPEPGATGGAISRMVTALQSPPVTDRLENVGLDATIHSFNSGDSAMPITFAAYWMRDPG